MNKAKIADALGASQRVRLPHAPRDPSDALAMMEYVDEQLDMGRGLRPGRPSNPNWTLRRLVPFSTETWGALEERAEAFSAAGRRVSPAQLAAVLLDRALLGERASGGLYLDASPEETPDLRLANRGMTRTIAGSEVRRALIRYLTGSRVYERYDLAAREERRASPSRITPRDVERLGVLRVRGYRQAWQSICDLGEISELAALDLNEDLTRADDDCWKQRVRPQLEALATVLFPDAAGSRGRDYSGAAKLVHQKRDWLPVLDGLVRDVLDMPYETGRTSVEQRRERWASRTEVVRQQIWRNREALLDYQERLRADRLGIGRPIELSTARILDIVLWRVGQQR